jgi:hypothetical protein
MLCCKDRFAAKNAPALDDLNVPFHESEVFRQLDEHDTALLDGNWRPERHVKDRVLLDGSDICCDL